MYKVKYYVFKSVLLVNRMLWDAFRRKNRSFTLFYNKKRRSSAHYRFILVVKDNVDKNCRLKIQFYHKVLRKDKTDFISVAKKT